MKCSEQRYIKVEQTIITFSALEVDDNRVEVVGNAIWADVNK